MENYQIADKLKETARLMELHDENAFKVKSWLNASFQIDRLSTPLESLQTDELSAIKGIGKSLANTIRSLIEKGEIEEFLDLSAKTPEGVQEMMRIKGLGPKKTAQLWKELSIESPGELLYACKENRLLTLKGFGEKTQSAIQAAIEFNFQNKGWYHYAKAERIAELFLEQLQTISSSLPVPAGDFNRRMEVVNEIVFVGDPSLRTAVNSLSEQAESAFEIQSTAGNILLIIHRESRMPINLHLVATDQILAIQFSLTGSTDWFRERGIEQHLTEIQKKNFSQETDIFTYLGMDYILPEQREAGIRPKAAGKLIRYEHLKGCLHNHTVWSDGIHTVERMAEECMRMGLTYFGVCDHSRSAFYANGLSAERVQEQWKEIDALNLKLAPFRILKGIESDILADGSLDYDESVLRGFDFIVASVHSQLKMDEEKATLRLIRAIENPYTRILGHPTSRLLLGRPGYPLDYERIFQACKQHGVVIELNANPYRLDIDWRLIQRALEMGLQIAINPDAHELGSLSDMRYGVLVARKAGVEPHQVLNTADLSAIENWILRK